MECLKKKDLPLLANKLIEKIPDACNAKEYHESFLKSKIKKLVKQSKIITQKPKTMENPNINDIKSVL